MGSMTCLHLLVLLLASNCFAGPVPERGDRRSAAFNKSAPVVAARELNRAEPTTESRVGYTIIKWTLVGVIILIPIVLLPLLICCNRRNGNVGEGSGEEDPATRPLVLHAIPRIILLYPIGPSLDDFYLAQYKRRQDPAGLVHKDVTGELHYLLSSSATVALTEREQLLHLPSGVLFIPIAGCTFDRTNQCVRPTQDKMQLASPSNLVFNRETGQIYERCLALSFQGDSPDSQWQLAKSPTLTDLRQEAIRRVRPEELHLHPALQRAYADLLTHWQKAKQAAQGTCALTAAGKSPMCVELKSQGPKLGQVHIKSQPPQAANSLVLSKRDYTHMHPTDLAATPREDQPVLKRQAKSNI